MCGSITDIQSPTDEIRRGEKDIRRRYTSQGKKEEEGTHHRAKI